MEFEVAAAGDGTTDDWDAIQGVINVACEMTVNEDGCCEPWVDRGCVISFPTPKHSYVISRPLLVPGNKALRFIGTAPQAVAIRLSAKSKHSYVFEVLKPLFVNGVVLDHPCSFERLAFINGGIAFYGGHRGWTAIRECTFLETSSWAILDEGPDDGSSGDTEVSGCLVKGCARGFKIGAASGSAGWRIRLTRFLENFEADLVINTAGCHVTDCDFEGKAEGSTEPFVQVTGSGGDLRFNDVRFGGREDVPRDFVVVGPAADAEWVDAALADLQFVGCDFRGALTTGQTSKLPSITEARSALRLASPVHGLQIRDCTSGAFLSLVLESGLQRAFDAEAQLLPGTEKKRAQFGERCRDNLLAYHVEEALSHSVFGVAGRGFEIVGRAMRERLQLDALPERRGGNLLRTTQPAQLGGSLPWTHTKATLEVSGQAGDQVFYLARVAAGPAFFRQSIPAIQAKALVGETAVFSAWFKLPATTSVTEYVGLAVLAGQVVIGGNLDVDLAVTSEWRRFDVVTERVPNLPNVTCVIRVGAEWATGAVVHMRGPQFESGDVPTAFVPSTKEGVHAERDDQSLVVGPLVIGYAQPSGSGEPLTSDLQPVTTEGRRVGDGLLNVEPVVGGPEGWVCVEHPATKQLVWRRYGNVE